MRVRGGRYIGREGGRDKKMRGRITTLHTKCLSDN